MEGIQLNEGITSSPVDQLMLLVIAKYTNLFLKIKKVKLNAY